jgi:hypothetical protein
VIDVKSPELSYPKLTDRDGEPDADTELINGCEPELNVAVNVRPPGSVTTIDVDDGYVMLVVSPFKSDSAVNCPDELKLNDSVPSRTTVQVPSPLWTNVASTCGSAGAHDDPDKSNSWTAPFSSSKSTTDGEPDNADPSPSVKEIPYDHDHPYPNNPSVPAWVVLYVSDNPNGTPRPGTTKSDRDNHCDPVDIFTGPPQLHVTARLTDPSNDPGVFNGVITPSGPEENT